MSDLTTMHTGVRAYFGRCSYNSSSAHCVGEGRVGTGAGGQRALSWKWACLGLHKRVK